MPAAKNADYDYATDDTVNDELLSQPASKRSLLTDAAILRHMKAGTVRIEPFNPQQLSTSSYDVTLGDYYYRENVAEPGIQIFNPYSQSHVERVWGTQPLQAELVSAWVARTNQSLSTLDNIAPTDRVIWIAPGETILAHTDEYIGGRETVTTMMKARSSMGRCFIIVCACAGWGDVGYTNRWTMEITNKSRHYSIPLVVGRRIAQIIFFEGDPILNNEKSYDAVGKYQTTDDLEEMKRSWQPSMMLPKMYMDREVREMKQKQQQSAEQTVG